jgi:DNA polymerase
MNEASLKELGLWPLWQKKDVAQATPPAPPAQPDNQEPAGGVACATSTRSEEIMRMNWQALQQSVAGCTACPLAKTRTRTVFGVGDPHSDWLFVGEAPGAEEDAQGEPFVGQAGKLLDNMLAAIALKRGNNVCIANVVKCRPPDNRNPETGEMAACAPYLTRQIELIRPRLIVALGRVAAQRLLATGNTIASLRGKLHQHQGIPLMVTYHPAYLLRNLPDKARAWEDLCLAVKTMQDLKSTEPPEDT